MRPRGLAWRKQHPIEHYVVDFCCLRARVVVEIDGASHDSKVEYDRQREAELTSQGFEVLHYGHSQVLENASGIAEFLEAHCVERAKLLFGEDYARRRDTSRPPLP